MLLAALLGACDATTAPVPGAEAGRYVATALAGRPLPALTDSAGGEFGVLLADTLDLDGRGGARRAIVVRRVVPARGEDTVYRSDWALAYRLAGTRLEVGSFEPCNDVIVAAACVANDTGSVAGARLALTSHYSRVGDRTVTFGRVP